MTHFVCPHCGEMSSSDIEAYAIDFDNGCPPSFFPVGDLAQGRERHIDTRLCCQECWERAGKAPLANGLPHPYGWRRHGARLGTATGTIIGSRPIHKE